MLNARKEARIQASQPTPVKPVAQTTPTVQTPQTIQQPAWNY